MRESICLLDTAIRDVLEAVNAAPSGIAFVNDRDGKLCGVLTDGDLRRLLLGGKSLDHRISRGDLGEFAYAHTGEDIQALLKRIDYRVRFLPIVDEEFRLVDYFRYEHRLHMTPVAQPDLTGRELEYLTDAFLSTWISSRGKYIDTFEANFADYCGAAHGISTFNGTTALHLALTALEIGPGDEVIVPDLTFAATANAVLHAGATPVLVDVDSESWTLDPQEVERAITPQTKAVIPVHLYGQPCDMGRLMSLAADHGLRVIEDCAEAHGAEYGGAKVGSFGDIACFSFFGNKIITTGEGGMCVTQSASLDGRLRVLRDHGMTPGKSYWHDVVGFNYRMTNLQAAIGCAQLERIDQILADNDTIEREYQEALQEVSSIEWQRRDLPNRRKVVWLVSCRVEDRDGRIRAMKRYGLDARPFFHSLSSMPIYRAYGFSSERSRQIAATGLNLPTIESVDYAAVATCFTER